MELPHDIPLNRRKHSIKTLCPSSPTDSTKADRRSCYSIFSGGFVHTILIVSVFLLVVDRLTSGYIFTDEVTRLRSRNIDNNVKLLSEHSSGGQEFDGHPSKNPAQTESELEYTLKDLKARMKYTETIFSKMKSDVLDFVSKTISSATATARERISNDIFDTSDVHMSVMENLDINGKNRWVFACTLDREGACRRAKQQDLAIAIMESISTRMNDSNENEGLRVAQIGSCAYNLLNVTLNRVGLKIREYTIVMSGMDSNEVGRSKTQQLACHNSDGLDLDLFEKNISKLKKQFKDVDIVLDNSIYDPSIAPKVFEEKSLDLVFLDSSPISRPSVEDLSLWFKKLDNNGVMMGHHYGALRIGKNNSLKDVNVSWLGSDERLSRAWLADTKAVVDSFVLLKMERAGGIVQVAGDTVWYVHKRKLKFSDITN